MSGFSWYLGKHKKTSHNYDLISLRSICLWILIIAASGLANLGSAWAQPWAPPPPPEIAPIISETYSNDMDGDRIDDELQAFADDARTVYQMAVTQTERDDALSTLDTMIDVELVFKEPITQQQIDDFLSLDSEITYVYKGLSYGWNGRIPLRYIDALPLLMGPPLMQVVKPTEEKAYMDKATQTGRVRPIWKDLGFRGDSNITIGIVDSGVDGSQTDFAGRKEYWMDQTGESPSIAVDYNGHGTHVAGIALGSGVAGGKGPNAPYSYTQTGNLDGVPVGSFYRMPIDLPSGQVRWKSIARWTGGGQASLYHLQRPKGSTQSWRLPSGSNSIKGYSPLTLEDSFRASSDNLYTAALLSEGSVQNYVIVNEVTDPSGTGDQFNKFSGVAPECKWAAVKVKNRFGETVGGGSSQATDHLVIDRRILNNIKIINVSRGATMNGLPAEYTAWRDKTNNAVRNGVVVVVSAGNNGDESTEVKRKMADPARTALAITVGASNDENNLTDYTTYGFGNPDSSEDYKPDVIAPGGSILLYTQILSVDSDTANDRAFADQKAHDYASKEGTSMASPFVASCAALVIDAMQQKGVTWDFRSDRYPRYVKMVLCATATETNTDRENGHYNPSLQRANYGPDGFPRGKDRYEGYGIVNPDAAVEAVALTCNWGESQSGTLGPDPTGKRAWARTVHLSAGSSNTFQLDNPTGCDFDLYLYSATPNATGTPNLLDWSTSETRGADEQIDYQSSQNMDALLVVKRVSGSGTFQLTGTASSPANLSVTPSEGLSSSGNKGGPFSPISKSYTLRNTGGESLSWTTSKTENWINRSPQSGELAPGRSTTVTVSINTNVYNLLPGTHLCSVLFTNTTNGNGNATREVRLQVGRSTPKITVTYPNGGESLQTGTSLRVTWTKSGNPGSNVSIVLLKAGLLARVVDWSTANDGSYDWTIPTDLDTGSDYTIKIASTTNFSYSDESDGYFSITAPNVDLMSIR